MVKAIRVGDSYFDSTMEWSLVKPRERAFQVIREWQSVTGKMKSFVSLFLVSDVLYPITRCEWKASDA